MRCLIVGCGCRGLALAGELTAAGHVVRGTTRDPKRVPVLAAAGVEPVVADPDRVATLVPALEHAAAVCLLLGSVDSAAVHGPRLEMLLTKILDTTVRGIVYEAAGSAPVDVLRTGAALVTSVCEHSRIAYELLDAEPADHSAWLTEAQRAVSSVISR